MVFKLPIFLPRHHIKTLPIGTALRHCLELHVGVARTEQNSIYFLAIKGPTRSAIRWSKIYPASTFGISPMLALPRMLYIVDALSIP